MRRMKITKFRHLFVTIFTLCQTTIGVGSSSLTLGGFKAHGPVSHVVEFNNTYYIGSTNFIYHVSSSFQVLQILEIGPKGNEDNRVTQLLVSPDADKPVMFWCGSIDSGLCRVNMLNNINGGNYLEENYFPNRLRDLYNRHGVKNRDLRQVLEHGVYGHLGSKAGNKALFVDISSSEQLSNDTRSKHIILSSAVYDGRQNLSLPIIGYYSLRKRDYSSNYYIRPTVFHPVYKKYSWLSILNTIAHKYPIYHVSMVEHGDYVYLVRVQKETVTYPLATVRFHTRIARFIKTDVEFKSYIEAPVNCVGDGQNYNVATDAVLGDAADDLSSTLGNHTKGKVFFLLKGSSGRPLPYPTLNSAAICAVPLATLDAHLDRDIRRCNRGRGSLVEWYYKTPKRCEASTLVGNGESRALYLLMKARDLNLRSLQTLEYNATMLRTDVQRQTTVAVVGDDQGFLRKISLASGVEYHRQDLSSGGSPVQREALVADGKLVATSGSKVVAFPLRSCELYESAEACTGTADAMSCGWCDQRWCSTVQLCRDSGATEWSHHAPPPEVYSVSPVNGSLHGNTALTVTGNHFTNEEFRSTVAVTIHGVDCRVTAVRQRRLTCVTGVMSTPWVGKVVVVRTDKVSEQRSSIPTQGHNSAVVFSYMTPQVTELVPSYGPMAGGTTLTIKGTNLTVGNSVGVMLRDRPCALTSLTADMLTCRTPLHLKTESVPLFLLSDGKVQFSSSFSFRPNPSIVPLMRWAVHSILSGGIPVCLDGMNFESVSNPTVEFTYPSSAYQLKPSIIKNCSKLSNSRVCCSIPNLTHMITMSRVSSFSTIQSNMTLRLDSVTTPVGAVIYHHQPVIHGISAIQYAASTVSITIKGSGFRYLNCDMIRIRTSRVPCNVSQCGPVYIACTLDNTDGTFEDTLQQVTFMYGDLSVKLDTSIIKRSVTSADRAVMGQPKMSYSDILMVCAAGMVVVIIVMIAAACIVTRRFRKKASRPEVEPTISYISGNENGTTVDLTDNEAYISFRQHSGSTPVSQSADMHTRVRSKGALIELSRLHVGGQIGSGCFGKVFKGFLDDKEVRRGDTFEVTRQPVAIKTVKGCQIDEEEMSTFVDEALLMQTFNHQHVLTMLGISFDIYGQPLVILPFLGRGDLCSYLRNPRNSVSMHAMIGFATDICMGMNYLEDVLCVHRDLAARNCMLDDNMRVKVADFGLSRDLVDFNNESYQSTAKAVKLPVKWMSLESLQYRHYSSKSDVWSYGVTLWEIFSRGAHPYPDVDNFDIIDHIQSGGRLERPKACPAMFYELMRSTWTLNPEERPTFALILSELQLIHSNKDCLFTRDDSGSISSRNNSSSRRTKSTDSGHVSDIDFTEEASVEDYLTPSFG